MEKAKTIREIITDYQNEILSEDLQPDRAAEILIKISALFGNLNDEIRIADMEYNKELLRCLESEEKANRAKIKAEISSQFNRKRIARDTKELAIEMIRSLKYFLRAKEEEYGEGRNF